MMPRPPACAMAIASRASVTVSMAAEMIGIDSEIERVSRVRGLDLGGQHGGRAGLHQHVVEGQIFGNMARRHGANLSEKRDSSGDWRLSLTPVGGGGKVMFLPKLCSATLK